AVVVDSGEILGGHSDGAQVGDDLVLERIPVEAERAVEVGNAQVDVADRHGPAGWVAKDRRHARRIASGAQTGHGASRLLDVRVTVRAWRQALARRQAPRIPIT